MVNMRKFIFFGSCIFFCFVLIIAIAKNNYYEQLPYTNTVHTIQLAPNL